jgi:sulfatase maturation enzyme AslB (radical SAM superfamily)
MNSEECRQCWAVQMCPHCFTAGIGGQFSSKIKEGPCSNHRQRLETIITNYCAVLEENSTAFDYMAEYLIS